MAAHSVSVVVPTWNGRRLLEEFLPSVLAAARRYKIAAETEVEIVVVDDGSTDDTQVWMADFSARAEIPVRSVVHEVNRGFGEACNTGIRAAAHPLTLLLNNDLEIAPDSIAPLARHFHDGRPVFAVHCRAIDFASGAVVGAGQAAGFRRGFLRVHDRFEPGPGDQPPFRSIFASGGCAMFDRERFLALGGFDAIFAPFYYEDVELSLRAWKRGYEVHYEPAAAVRHRFSSTIGAQGRARVKRISHRNRLLMHWIHLHERSLFARHVVWTVIAALAALVTFRPLFVLALKDALLMRREVWPRRARERRLATRTMADVIDAVVQKKARS